VVKTMKVAFLYDFDKTLSPKDMQEYGFIEAIGFEDAGRFWSLVDQTAKEEKMDRIMAYLYEMVRQAKRHGVDLTREFLADFGKNVVLFPGVETWFASINAYASFLGIELEHYIVSSGLREIIERTSIAKEFRAIYACEFLYGEDQIAVWPKLSINYTNKMQFIFRVNKGILDIFNDVDLNSFTPEKDRPVPLTRMVYFGDGLTDVPSMKLVKSNGGHSISVYTKKTKEASIELAKHERVDFIAPADYSDDGELMAIAKNILSHLFESDKLENKKWKEETGHD